MNTRIRPIALLTLGFGWLAAVLWMIVENVILRETRLGIIARFLDRLPPKVANPMFILLWIVTLLGWIVPLALGFRWMLRSNRSG